MSRRRIGVFDSGVGGLTVVRHVLGYVAGGELLYLGDTARVPYGSRSPETIRRYTQELTYFLREQEVELIVVACNTISAVAVDVVRQCAGDIPVVDVLEPTVELALQRTQGRIGIVGTRATIASGVYQQLLQQRSQGAVHVWGQACPLFVPLVEEGWIDHPVTQQVAREYLEPLQRAGIDTLILGCTHYPLLLPVFRRLLPECCLVEPGEAVAQRLEQMGYAATRDGVPARLEVYLTDSPGPAFAHIVSRLRLAPFRVCSVALREHV